MKHRGTGQKAGKRRRQEVKRKKHDTWEGNLQNKTGNNRTRNPKRANYLL